MSQLDAMIDPLGRADGRNPHSLQENVVGILTGTLLVSLGVVLYTKSALLIGGCAGMAQLLAYVSPVEFWLGFFLLNLPFYGFALRSKGRAYVARTLCAVTLECALVRAAPDWIDISTINPAFAAIAGGALIGVGLMCLFRHNTSLGGIGILAQYLQERHGIRSGSVQMTCDTAILFAGAWILPVENLALSILGAFVVNGLLVLHHRSDRYIGVT